MTAPTPEAPYTPTLSTAPFKKGDLLRRLVYGQNQPYHPRLFRVSMVSAKAGVFTALSADGEWSDWGGTFPEPSTYEIVKETK